MTRTNPEEDLPPFDVESDELSFLTPEEKRTPLPPEAQAQSEDLARLRRKSRPMSYEEKLEQVRMNELLTPPGEYPEIKTVPIGVIPEWKSRPPMDPAEREKWLKEESDKVDARIEGRIARERVHRSKVIREQPEVAKYLLKLADRYKDEELRAEVERALGEKET